MSPRRDYLTRLEQYLSDAAKSHFSERYARYLAGCVLREAVSEAGEARRVATLESLASRLIPRRSQSYLYRLMRIAEAMPLYLERQGRPPRNPRQITFEEFEKGGCNQLGLRKLEGLAPAESEATTVDSSQHPRRPGRPRKQRSTPGDSAPEAKQPFGIAEELDALKFRILKLASEMEDAIRRGHQQTAIFTGNLLRFSALCRGKCARENAGLIRDLPIDRFACPDAQLHVWGYSFQSTLIDELVSRWGFQRVGHVTLKSPRATDFEHGPWWSASSICVNAMRGNLAFRHSHQMDFITVDHGEDWESAKLKLHLQLVSSCGLIELLPTSPSATWRGFDQ